MNGDAALTWREVISDQCARHCAALLDDVTARLDSELEKARTETAARTEARVRAEEQSLADAIRDAAKAEADDLRAEADRTRAEADRARADAEQARAEVERAKAEAERSRAEAESIKLRSDAARTEAEADKVHAVREARLSAAETLNQAVRRLRQAPAESAAFAILLDCATTYAAQAVVLRVENNQVHPLGFSGAERSVPSFPLDSAPAIANVCENREPVVALAAESELSRELAYSLSSGDPSRKAYLFPVSVRQNVMAVLVAAGDPAAAALELLGETAGMKLESLLSETALKPLPSPELVRIEGPSVPETPNADRLSWSDLSPEDQKLHLQAQRVARVKVAEIRLYHAEELRKGVFDGNIYSALQPEIDQARAGFLQDFLSKSRTMVDYLHLEILRSLAHEDDRLLGHDYPGPMV